jgi:hypothetical protein
VGYRGNKTHLIKKRPGLFASLVANSLWRSEWRSSSGSQYAEIRNSGNATDETSYYPALKLLCDAIGSKLLYVVIMQRESSDVLLTRLSAPWRWLERRAATI